MSNDEDLRRDVVAALQWEPGIDSSGIEVAVTDGIVKLTGSVPVYVQKFVAEKVVKGIRGVRCVVDDVGVHPPEDGRRTDVELAEAALAALRWDAAVPDDRIKALVRDGWIILEGTVERQYERAAADHAVRRLVGARGVTNNVLVKPEVEGTDDARAGIEASIRRSAILPPERFRVEVRGDTVVLRGDADSYAQRSEAERLAWAAPGVAHVENHIAIAPRGD
jgi:osmotically-inducible protein OsmY